MNKMIVMLSVLGMCAVDVEVIPSGERSSQNQALMLCASSDDEAEIQVIQHNFASKKLNSFPGFEAEFANCLSKIVKVIQPAPSNALHQISFQDNVLTDASLMKLIESLESYASQISYIDLSNNRITLEGATGDKFMNWALKYETYWDLRINPLDRNHIKQFTQVNTFTQIKVRFMGC